MNLCLFDMELSEENTALQVIFLVWKQRLQAAFYIFIFVW